MNNQRTVDIETGAPSTRTDPVDHPPIYPNSYITPLYDPNLMTLERKKAHGELNIANGSIQGDLNRSI